MKILVLSKSDVQKLLSVGECIEVLESAFRYMGQDKTLNPLRTVMKIPNDKGFFGLMPAYMEMNDGKQVFGMKAISVFPGNHGNTPYESHTGTITLFEGEFGQPIAIVDASQTTAVRTAAASGVATKYLAKQGEGLELAILGSGTQAVTHLEAMLHVRKFSKVKIWSRNPEHAKKFAEEATRKVNEGIYLDPNGQKIGNLQVKVVSSAKDAIEGSDVICTVTASPVPILDGNWLKPGCHINAVGASNPRTREVDTNGLLRSKLYTDKRESLLNEAGEYIIPAKEGLVNESHLKGEIADLLLGRVEGRISDQEITMFKSLGIGVEDISSSYHMYKKAIDSNVGTCIDFGASSGRPKY